MSYSLERSRAVLLFHQEGTWSLEVEELVRLNRNTFRPKRHRLLGRDAILHHLAINQGVLVGPTKRLLDGGLADESFSYEVRGESWIPAPPKELVKTPRTGQEDASEEAAIVREILALRARVASLEGSLVGLPAGAVVAKPGAAAAAGEAVAPAAEAAEAATAPEAPPPEKLDFKPLNMPPPEAVLGKVQGLTDESVTVNKMDPLWDFQDPPGYLGLLHDDSGTVRGGLAMDLRATVRLAGAMLMEEEEDLVAQIEAGKPSDDVLDAASEVLNTLTSTVNKVSGNAHVKVDAVKSLSLEDDPWLKQTRSRLDFAVSVGGYITFLGR